MFKRSTKITSLLVAAASVASMVPAYAADYKKIDSQDGTVYNAVAYKDGESYIDGKIGDKDDATYYLKDGKYNDLSDIDSGSDVQTYGSKYVEEGTQYDGDNYLDLSTGKVTDEQVAQNALDDASSALRRKVKKDAPSRYADGSSVLGQREYALTTSEMETAKNNVPSNKFADDWYQVSYTADSDSKVNGAATSFAVYTDNAGNYIDADYNLGKIPVVLTNGTTTDAAVYVKNTTDAEGDKNIKAAVTGIKTIGQDKDYIYRLASITVNKLGAQFGSKNNAVNPVGATTDSAVTSAQEKKAGWTEESTSYVVIQKISKAQASDDANGAKYAKTVSTYFVTKKDGKKVDTGKVNILDPNCQYVINNGKIIAYDVNGSSVAAVAVTLKTDNGYNYTDLSDGDSQDLDSHDTNYDKAVDVDVDGNVYAVDAGYVYKFNNDDSFEKIYKVDGSFDRLSVYDQNDMVLWSSDTDDEVYSVVGSKTKSDDNTDTNNNGGTTTTAQVGWVQNTADGSWSYYANGAKLANQWVQSGSTWYFLNENGVMMANGWLQNGGAWYYLAENGAMKTGWVQLSGNWYYLAPNGAMKTGWFQDTAGTWYYANESGVMLHDTTVGGYTLGSNGALV